VVLYLQNGKKKSKSLGDPSILPTNIFFLKIVWTVPKNTSNVPDLELTWALIVNAPLALHN